MACAVRLAQRTRLQGSIVYARQSHTPVNAFLGIPYAKPPVGQLRFKGPRPVELWEGTQDATRFGPICPQPRAVLEKMMYPFPIPQMNEDCLYLNVWTPSCDSSAKLPVMVWIHGGGFVNGLSDYYNGTAFAALQNVVFVSLNYRLGPLGFLATGDGVVPGNMGFLDQVEALRWIQKYISQFGGDPDNVTIFGESAGAISSALHLLSPMSRNLFRRAICESGSCLYPDVVWSRKNSRKYMMKKVKAMGCKAETSEAVVQFLRSLTIEELVKGFAKGMCGLVVDGTFLPEHPMSLYAKGEVKPADLMIGINTHEGAFFIFNLNNEKQIETMARAEELVNFTIRMMFYRGSPKADQIVQAVMKKYLKDKRAATPEQLTEGLVDMYGDLLFNAPTVEMAEQHSAKASTYMYQFAKRPCYSQYPDWVVADHAHEILFVIGEPFLGRFPDIWSEEERRLSQLMMSYWANFARTGNPNHSSLPEWPKFDAQSQQYFVLGDSPSVETHFMPDRMDFWNNKIPAMENMPHSKY